MITLTKYPYKKDRLKWLSDQVKNRTLTQLASYIQNPLTREPLNASPHSFLAVNLSLMGLYSTLIEQDIRAAKQYFYLSGLAKLRSYFEFEKSAQTYYSLGIQDVFPVLFSDASHLYSVFANVDSPENKKLTSGKYNLGYITHRLYQLCLGNRWDEVKAICDDLRAKNYDKEDWLDQRLAFFEALCEKNADKVEATLDSLLSLKSVKRDNYYFKDLTLGRFMCAPGMWYAKLAWICGFEIEIKHPMIVSELLPVKPLDQYVNPYDFLIDPVLEKKSLLFYGGDVPAQDVEKANQLTYGNTRFSDPSKKPENLTDFKIELFDRVFMHLPDMHQWIWEQSKDSFVFKNKKVLLKVIIKVYPFEPKHDLNRHLEQFVQVITQSVDTVHQRTGNTFNDDNAFCRGIEFVDDKAPEPVYHYQLIKLAKVDNDGFCVSILCLYKDPKLREMAEQITSWLQVK